MCGTSNSKIKNGIAPVCLMSGFLWGDIETNSSVTFEKRKNILVCYLSSCWKETRERYRLYSWCACLFRRKFLLCCCVIMENLENWGADCLVWIHDLAVPFDEARNTVIDGKGRMDEAGMSAVSHLVYVLSLKEKLINLFKNYFKNWFASATVIFLLIFSWLIYYPR